MSCVVYTDGFCCQGQQAALSGAVRALTASFWFKTLAGLTCEQWDFDFAF